MLRGDRNCRAAENCVAIKISVAHRDFRCRRTPVIAKLAGCRRGKMKIHASTDTARGDARVHARTYVCVNTRCTYARRCTAFHPHVKSFHAFWSVSKRRFEAASCCNFALYQPERNGASHDDRTAQICAHDNTRDYLSVDTHRRYRVRTFRANPHCLVAQ